MDAAVLQRAPLGRLNRGQSPISFRAGRATLFVASTNSFRLIVNQLVNELTLDLKMPDTARTDMPDEQPRDLFVRVLAVDKTVAELLIANEITTLEEVAYVPEEELTSIEGLDQRLER